MRGWRVYVDQRPWDGGTKLFLTAEAALGRRSVVLPLQMVEMDGGAPYDAPTLQQSRNEQQDNMGDVDGFLQAMLDEAWRIGMRPKGFADHTNELAAVRYHLEDMRGLAKVPPRS